jgi:hypothetical protein
MRIKYSIKEIEMAQVLAAFTHQATAANTFGDTTVIDNQETNNKPNAILLITNIAIPGPGGTIPGHAQVTAAAYITANNQGIPNPALRDRWSIWNVNRAHMTMNAVFNVVLVTP